MSICSTETIHQRVLAALLFWFISSPLLQCSSATSGKVVDFGDKLPEYIKENPHKGWLIKFYTPWCYNCQQIELTYIEVAEKIYHAHDHLIVGQVNCDKYDKICRQYNVEGVPTILYLRANQRQAPSKYNGLRQVNSIVSFAERMNGPDVNVIQNCHDIIPEIERRGIIILLSGASNSSSSSSNDIQEAFNSIAAQMKRDFWFYKLDRECKNNALAVPQEPDNYPGIYILKRNLRRWIRFEPKKIRELPSEESSLEEKLKEFILKESFPVFGPLSNQMMNSTKLLAVAVLDEYGPARKLDLMSKKFYTLFEQVAIDESQESDQIQFAWSTDLHAIKKIALSHVQTPNVILLKSDLSNNLLIKQSMNGINMKVERKGQEMLPDTLSKEAVLKFIQAARRGELVFSGGDAYHYRVARYIYSYVIMIKDRYEANPVLTSLMLISMATTTIVLMYKTKTYLRDDDEDQHRNIMPQSNHRKQD